MSSFRFGEGDRLLDVYIATFNANATNPATADLATWLGVDECQPDIYAIGCQEIVSLNIINFVGPEHASGAWERRIDQTINAKPKKNERQPYVLVCSKQLVGILLTLFVKQDLFPFISSIQFDTVGVGFFGVGGNKGAVAIRINLFDTSLCFITAHLDANQSDPTGRNANFHAICRRINLHDYKNKFELMAHDSRYKKRLNGSTSSPSTTSSNGTSSTRTQFGEAAVLNNAEPSLINPYDDKARNNSTYHNPPSFAATLTNYPPHLYAATRASSASSSAVPFSPSSRAALPPALPPSSSPSFAPAVSPSSSSSSSSSSSPRSNSPRMGPRVAVEQYTHSREMVEQDEIVAPAIRPSRHLFFFGDLNYRLNIANTPELFEQTQLLLSTQHYLSLLPYDQLNNERDKGEDAAFGLFEEGELTFPPTYKYQPQTDLYEQRSTKKRRIPAWCDRVMWLRQEEGQVKQVNYRRHLQPNTSDHKAVSSFFQVRVHIGRSRPDILPHLFAVSWDILELLHFFVLSSMWSVFWPDFYRQLAAGAAFLALPRLFTVLSAFSNDSPSSFACVSPSISVSSFSTTSSATSSVPLTTHAPTTLVGSTTHAATTAAAAAGATATAATTSFLPSTTFHPNATTCAPFSMSTVDYIATTSNNNAMGNFINELRVKISPSSAIYAPYDATDGVSSFAVSINVHPTNLFMFSLCAFVLLLALITFNYLALVAARLVLKKFRRRFRFHQATTYPWWRFRGNLLRVTLASLAILSCFSFFQIVQTRDAWLFILLAVAVAFPVLLGTLAWTFRQILSKTVLWALYRSKEMRLKYGCCYFEYKEQFRQWYMVKCIYLYSFGAFTGLFSFMPMTQLFFLLTLQIIYTSLLFRYQPYANSSIRVTHTLFHVQRCAALVFAFPLLRVTTHDSVMVPDALRTTCGILTLISFLAVLAFLLLREIRNWYLLLSSRWNCDCLGLIALENARKQMISEQNKVDQKSDQSSPPRASSSSSASQPHASPTSSTRSWPSSQVKASSFVEHRSAENSIVEMLQFTHAQIKRLNVKSGNPSATIVRPSSPSAPPRPLPPSLPASTLPFFSKPRATFISPTLPPSPRLSALPPLTTLPSPSPPPLPLPAAAALAASASASMSPSRATGSASVSSSGSGRGLVNSPSLSAFGGLMRSSVPMSFDGQPRSSMNVEGRVVTTQQPPLVPPRPLSLPLPHPLPQQQQQQQQQLQQHSPAAVEQRASSYDAQRPRAVAFTFGKLQKELAIAVSHHAQQHAYDDDDDDDDDDKKW